MAAQHTSNIYIKRGRKNMTDEEILTVRTNVKLQRFMVNDTAVTLGY